MNLEDFWLLKLYPSVPIRVFIPAVEALRRLFMPLFFYASDFMPLNQCR